MARSLGIPELEKKISLFQVIALVLSFYVWSLLLKWCRLASVPCSSLVNAVLYALLQLAERDK